ncbi:hypothetical protein QBC38DRAFT_18129 [Podospora fimiseda]|uniref:Zn(2)-C6 fungal-type domain-containing protein n=1 Tax=Podospora fimiseda TaxID=252190 RepID=A0AAN7BJH4_9PEZI|nr:hypothetical protein QBC38DRAFT_18129 [Podospora fimiseda]
MATTNTPMRQSCDRCHGQKLRCQRSGDSDTGACQRCIRQGSQCVYSTSLPKGRPSQQNNQSQQIGDSTNPTTSTFPKTKSQRRPRARSRTSSSTSKTSTSSETITTISPSETLLNPTPTVTVKNDDSMSVVTTMPGGGVSADPMSTTATTSSTWPWQGGIFNWGDDEVQDFNEPPCTWSSSMPDLFIDPNGGQHEQLMDWTDAAIEDSSSHLEHTNNNHLLNPITPNPSSTDVTTGIVQLTHLSTRLCQLQGFVLAAIERTGPGGALICLLGQKEKDTGAISDKFAFKAIMAQLLDDMDFGGDLVSEQQFASVCNTMQEVFNASRESLGIFQCLQTEAASARSASPDSLLRSTTPSGGGVGGTVTRHLIMACHGMLLSIYATVLGALQRDADLILSGTTTTTMFESSQGNTCQLTDIRLVMIVQLCSYLIGRQQQAVDDHLVGPGVEVSGQNNPPSDLEVEVQQRLTHIRQTLRIA